MHLPDNTHKHCKWFHSLRIDTNDPAMSTLCTYNVLTVNIFLMGGFALEYVALGRSKT